MQIFKRESIQNHCVGAEWPDFLGWVELGESFVIETEEADPNGPVGVSGIKAGDDIAIHIEHIEMLPPFKAPNGGPFFEGMGPLVPLEYRDGYFYWPDHFRLKASPSVGNIAVLPEPTEEVLEVCRIHLGGPEKGKPNPRGWRTVVRAPRGKHCHQDCFAVTAGSVVRIKAQVDGAGICMDDVHGYIGQGEMAFAGIEVRASVQVRVERSTGWLVDWPLIETDQEIMVFSSYTHNFPHLPQLRYVDIVREAYHALREVVAARIGGTIEEANSIVATAVDLKNCALYGLGEGYIPQHKGLPPFDIAVVASLPKDVFID
ncbi:MAG: acetamidase/formamidase family protein [Dehalococcoidales bacterium]|nr:MAG: acetamidase/formamidase family protein [Dehalococcoidales bacterium]